MKCVDVNSPFKIFYKTNNLANDQNVVFNIWDDTGRELIVNEQGVEIGDEGVYYIEYTHPDPGYLVIIGSNSGQYPQPDVVKVGSPSLKAFYVNNAFQTGKRIIYEVYASNGNTIKSGFLQEVAGGFYYADVEGLAEPWFFQTYPNVKRRTECIAP